MCTCKLFRIVFNSPWLNFNIDITCQTVAPVMGFITEVWIYDQRRN